MVQGNVKPTLVATLCLHSRLRRMVAHRLGVGRTVLVIDSAVNSVRLDSMPRPILQGQFWPNRTLKCAKTYVTFQSLPRYFVTSLHTYQGTREITLEITRMNIMAYLHYGNTGCGVFKPGIQNQKDFCLKINIPIRKTLNFENWISMGLRSFQKSDF